MKPTDFAGTEPRMTLEDFFTGHSRAWGLFQDRFGNVRRQFTVDITGAWDPDKKHLELTEAFAYDDGERETRVWQIDKLDDSRYRATTPDCVGEARVEAHGNAVNLVYRLKLPIGGRSIAFDFDDWMFRQDDDVVINRALVKKWGLLVGTAIIFFRKDAAAGSGRMRDSSDTQEAAE
jgi:hypothetical protein